MKDLIVFGKRVVQHDLKKQIKEGGLRWQR